MMRDKSLVRRPWGELPAAALIFLVFVTACGSDGCDSDGFREAPFPVEHVDKTVPVSAEVRVTSHGLNFMGGQVDNLIGEFVDGGLSFCVPPVDQSGFEVCDDGSTCDDGSYGCQIELSIDDAQLRPEAPNKLVVEVVIGGLHESLPVDVPLAGECSLDLFSATGGESQPATAPVSVPIRLEVDTLSPFRDLRFVVEEMDLDLDDVGYKLGGGGLCAIGNALVQTFLDDTIRDLILGEVDGLVEDMTRSELCRTCEAGDSPCPNNSTCQGDDPPICMYQSTNECVPRFLGIDAVIEPEGLLGEYLAYETADIFLTGRVADRAVADSGITLGARTGTQPELYMPCAPVDLSTRPSFDPVDPSPSINSDVKPDGEPYMFGFAMHRRTLQHMMWSLWAAGALCLEVGSESVDMLTTSAIGVLVPEVNEIVLETGSMKLRISPQQPPDIRLGANRVVTNGNDQVVEEGLLILDWKDVDIHMYGFFLERYARLFSLRVDLEIPIALLPDGDNGVYPVLGDIEDGIQNIRVHSDDLLGADTEQLAEILPTLLGFALPELAEALSDPIELPEFMGYRVVLEPEDIRGIDNNQYLGLFANLEFVGSGQTNPYQSVLRAHVLEQRVDVERVEGKIPAVSATLEVGASRGGVPVMGQELQVVYRINGGMWKLGGLGGELRIDDAILKLQGEHLLELRARDLEPGSRWQREPTAVEIIVDYEAPRLEAWESDDVVVVRAEDVVDSVQQLKMRHRQVLNGTQQAWTIWDEVSDISLADLPANAEVAVEVQVRDRAGHLAQEIVQVRRSALGDGSEVGVDAPQGCGSGCAAVGGGAGGAATFLLFIVGFIAIGGRRRWRLFALATILAAAGLVSGCDDETSSNAECSEECGLLQECIEGQCVAIGCEADSECNIECSAGSFPSCDAGECICEDYCGEGCGSDQFCCFESNRCQTFPDACQGVSCETGYEPAVTHIGDHDSESCEVTGAQCECVSLPPLPLGFHGAYASFDEGGDDVLAVSVHNLRFRDLMVGILNKELEPTWYFVDGVPRRGQVRGALDGPRGGLINMGDRVGTHTATAVDDGGGVHVFYRDEDEKALKYARGKADGDEWSFETTFVEEEQGDTGYFSSVVLIDGTLHLFYSARVDEALSEIRHRAIAVDHPVEEMAETTYQVIHSGSRIVDGREDNLPLAGIHLQAVQADGEIFLSFFDNTIERASWLTGDGVNFNPPGVLDEPAGPFSSARPGPDGEIHVAYMDPDGPALSYQVVGGAKERIVSGVRHTPIGTSQTPIGHDVQLHLLDDGRVEVLYYDGSTHELVRGVRDGSWQLETLAGVAGEFSAGHGLFVRGLGLVGGMRLVMDFGVDLTGEERIGKPYFRLVD